MCCARCTCPYSVVPDVGWQLAVGLVPRHSDTRTFLAAVAVDAERLLLTFPMGDVWYLHRLRTGDVASLPLDDSGPPTFFPGDFARLLSVVGVFYVFG